MKKHKIDEGSIHRTVVLFNNLEQTAPAIWMCLLLVNALLSWLSYEISDQGIPWLSRGFFAVLGLQIVAFGVVVVGFIGRALGKVKVFLPLVILIQFVVMGITLLFSGLAETVKCNETICYVFATLFFLGLLVWYGLTWYWLRIDIENGRYRGNRLFPPKRIPAVLFWIMIGSLALIGGRHARGSVLNFFPSEYRSLYLIYIFVLANVLLCKLILMTAVYCYVVLKKEKTNEVVTETNDPKKETYGD